MLRLIFIFFRFLISIQREFIILKLKKFYTIMNILFYLQDAIIEHLQTKYFNFNCKFDKFPLFYFFFFKKKK